MLRHSESSCTSHPPQRLGGRLAEPLSIDNREVPQVGEPPAGGDVGDCPPLAWDSLEQAASCGVEAPVPDEGDRRRAEIFAKTRLDRTGAHLDMVCDVAQ